MTASKPSHQLTRRSVFGGAAALGGAALLGGSAAGISLLTATSPASAQADSTATVAFLEDISTLDPYQMFSRNEGSVADHLIQTLTARADDMSVVPLLAESWEHSDDYLTWTFTLRSGVVFSNGEPFNAAAAKFSIDHLLQRAVDGKPLGGATVAVPSAEIDSAEVVSDLVIAITSKSPKALLDLYMAQWPMVEPGFYATVTDEDAANTIVGTGPYIVSERVRDDHTTLTINPTYWGDAPTIASLVFRVIPENSTRIAELQTGGVDLVPALAIDQAQLLEGVDGVSVVTVEGGRRVFVGITTDGGPEPLMDVRVRQALNYAVDWESINQGLFLGQAPRMSHIFNPPFANESLTAYSYDPEKAKSLLTEAGYPDGFTIDAFATPSGRWVNDVQLAQVLMQQFEDIGITFTDGLQTFEWGVYREKLLAYDLPGLFLQASGGEFEAAGEAADFTFTSASDFYRWNNADYEALWTELQGELDMTRRTEIAMEMQAIIAEDAPVVFLYNQLDVYGIADRLTWTPRPDELIHLWAATVTA